jgi:flagellar basal-body rod modification protein FlgD
MITDTLAGTTPAPAQRTAEFTGRAGLAASDFETFLRMLTTQMQNQDPLNPMNATDFAQQLATFSGVEQQVRTNTLLASMAAQSGIGDLAGWVGMQARSAGPAAWSGAPLEMTLAAASGADRAALVVRNALGAQVDSQPVALDAREFRWNGLGPDGTPLPDGIYTFELVSFADGLPVATDTPEIYARVTEVRRDPSGPVIVLAGGIAAEPSQITALRR